MICSSDSFTNLELRIFNSESANFFANIFQFWEVEKENKFFILIGPIIRIFFLSFENQKKKIVKFRDFFCKFREQDWWNYLMSRSYTVFFLFVLWLFACLRQFLLVKRIMIIWNSGLEIRKIMWWTAHFYGSCYW